jgi:hypothetical protein
LILKKRLKPLLIRPVYVVRYFMFIYG